MEAMRRRDDYAGNQIRLLFNDLSNSPHSLKIKAIKRFQSYVVDYDPEVSEETIDFLFTGINESMNQKHGNGLLFWSGVDSAKHNGQLKRICAPAIAFIRFIITMEVDEGQSLNLYYERFVSLPLSSLIKMNLAKHITKPSNSEYKLSKAKGLIGGNNSRQGSSEDAFIILNLLVNDHRATNGIDDDPISALDLLRNDKTAYEKYSQWLQKTTAEQANGTINKQKKRSLRDEIRPTRWAEVNFHPVPLQEGEEGAIEESKDVNVIPTIPDPFGISDIDLRATQSLFSTGRLTLLPNGGYVRKSTVSAPGIPATRSKSISNANGGLMLARRNSTYNNRVGDFDATGLDEDEDDDDNDEDDQPPVLHIGQKVSRSSVAGGKRPSTAPSAVDTGDTPGRRVKRQVFSVVPSDRNFSPSLFLTLVHGNVNFNQLKSGLDHLKGLLRQQSHRRENLVRLHFGLFIQCAEGLEWLKAYKQGHLESSSGNPTSKTSKSNPMQPIDAQGQEMLNQALQTLDRAKKEAKSTLAPILERMKHARQVRNTEKVLKRMTKILEHPYKMRQALDHANLQEVISIYLRVKAMPQTTTSKMLKRVKDNAEEIISTVKQQCIAILLTPNPNHEVLIRYGKLINDLDGEEVYIEVMKQCLVRQLLQFVESIAELRNRFMEDAAEAFLRGEEQDRLFQSRIGDKILQKNPVRMTVSDRKQSASRRSALFQLNTGSSDRSSGKKDQYGAVYEDGDEDSPIGNGGFDVGLDEHEEKLLDEFDIDDDNDEELYWHQYYDGVLRGEGNIEDLLAFIGLEDETAVDSTIPFAVQSPPSEVVEASAAPGHRLSRLAVAGLNAQSEMSPKRSALMIDKVVNDSLKSSVKTSPRGSDHSSYLCSLVRSAYADHFVDLVAKWFPCLQRLVTDLSYHMSISAIHSTVTSSSSHTLSGDSLSHSRPMLLKKGATAGPSAFPHPHPVPSNAISDDYSIQTNRRPLSGSFSPNQIHPSSHLHSHQYHSKGLLARGTASPGKLLGMCLHMCSQSIYQMTLGVNHETNSSLRHFHIPDELRNAFKQLESILAAHGDSKPAHHPVGMHTSDSNSALSTYIAPSTAFTAVKTSNEKLVHFFATHATKHLMDSADEYDHLLSNKFNEIVNQSAFSAPLREPFMRETLEDVFNLYDGMEGIFKSALQTAEANLTSTTSGYNGTRPTGTNPSDAFIGGGSYGQTNIPGMKTITASSLASIKELKFLSPGSSPYYDSMSTLRNLAMEAETAATQMYMDKLLDLSQKLRDNRRKVYDVDMGSSRPDLRESQDGVGDHYKGSSVNMNRVEGIVMALERLMLSCLEKLKNKIKRPQWVSQIVRDGIVRVFARFMEWLRREVLLIEENKRNEGYDDAPLLTSVANKKPEPGPRNRKDRTGSLLLLQSMEDELKYSDVDLSNRGDQLLDLLRGCLRLRVLTIRRVWNRTVSYFPDPGSVDESTALFTLNQYHLLSLQDPTLKSPNGAMGGPINSQNNALSKLFTVTSNEDFNGSDSNVRPFARDDKPVPTTGSTAAAAVSSSLADRIKQLWEGHPSLSGIVLTTLGDVAIIEEQIASIYIDMKCRALTNAVYAGFAVVVHEELTARSASGAITETKVKPDNSTPYVVPVHLSRVLLMMGHDKIVLSRELRGLTIESGGKNSSVYEELHPPGRLPKMGRSVDLVMSWDSDDESEEMIRSPRNKDKFDEKAKKNRKEPSSGWLDNPMSAGEKYGDYLYKQLCVGILDIYADLVKKLKSNQFLALNSLQHHYDPSFVAMLISSSTTSCWTPKALGQVREEYEFLKVIIQPVVTSPVHHKNPTNNKKEDTALNEKTTASNASSFGGFLTNKPTGGVNRSGSIVTASVAKDEAGTSLFASSEQLINESKLISLMISNPVSY